MRKFFEDEDGETLIQVINNTNDKIFIEITDAVETYQNETSKFIVLDLEEAELFADQLQESIEYLQEKLLSKKDSITSK